MLGAIHTRDSSIDLSRLDLPQLDLHELDAIFTEDEVWGVIKELPSDRAPGPDGYNGRFFQLAWPVIKNDVMVVFLKLFVGDGRGFECLNRALLTLIPKKSDAKELGDYRPISLVHSLAKLFSKVLANRVRPHLANLVSPNQSAFIRGRSLHDNFMLVRQVARRINSKRWPGVLLKLDISRAFDSLSWAFLMEVLRKLGFSERFLRWVALMLYTASTKVLVNGVPGRKIVHGRGLRQGDPISPMFFVMAMEVLSALIRLACEEQLLSSFPGISPLQRLSVYADDAVLFVKPLVLDLHTVKILLHMFGVASGLHINYSKTTATMIRGSPQGRALVRNILRCRIVPFTLRYLGMQLALRPLTKAE
jgi:hypothetical protein